MVPLRFVKTVVAVVLTFLVLSVAANAASANGASPFFSDDPKLLWAEWSLIRDGQAPPTSIYPIIGSEFQERYGTEDPGEPTGTQNTFSLVLRPYWGTFSLPPSGPLGRSGETFSPAANRLYWSLRPFLEVQDDLQVGDWFHARIHMDQRMDAGKMTGLQGNFFSAYVFESSMPREGFVSVSADSISLAFGRLRSGIGHGYFGNTFLNGKANYYDQIQLTGRAGDFKFFYMLGTSDSLLTPAEQTIQGTHWDFPVYSDPYKTFAYHRIEYSPISQLVFGAGEANMIGGRAPDFQNIIPFNIWHNTYSYGYKNVLMVLDVSAVPVKGLHLFGEFLLDDLKLEREGGSRKPNALGWQAGARYVLPWGSEIMHMVGLEYTHIDPWTYNTFQPYLMFYQRQPYASSVTDWYMDFPLGYAYGPDVDHYGVYYRAISKRGLRWDVSYFHMIQGEVELGAYDADEPWYDYNDQLPIVDGHVGTVEIYDTVSFSVHYPVWMSLSIFAQGSYSAVQNLDHVLGQSGCMYAWALGLEYKF